MDEYHFEMKNQLLNTHDSLIPFIYICSNSFTLPVSGRTRGGPPSPHSSRNQILNSKEPLLQGACYSSGIEDDGIKFVDVPKDRKLSGQRLPLSGSARHRRPSSGSAQKDERHGSSNSQRETPNDLDDDEVFHPYKTISQQEIVSLQLISLHLPPGYIE